MVRQAWVLLSVALLACGGESKGDGAGGTGGTSSGTGGTAGGTGGTGGAGMVCCDAIATCGPNEQQIASLDACPDGASCRELSVCCSTIVCATPATCRSVPVCDDGDAALQGTCSPDQHCYTRTRCGGTITCSDDYCDPNTEPNRSYVSTGNCEAIDLQCPTQTTYFANGCGCGCEQDPDCPSTIDCSPGPDPRPECSDANLAHCPYSLRAL